MASRTGRLLSMAAALGLAFPVMPSTGVAEARGWGDAPSCRGLEGRERARCERDRDNWERDRSRRDREHQRERRRDDRADRVVAGVVGAVIIGGLIAAATSGDKDRRRDRERRSYCKDRYGNYVERNESYRAADGRWYRCQ